MTRRLHKLVWDDEGAHGARHGITACGHRIRWERLFGIGDEQEVARAYDGAGRDVICGLCRQSLHPHMGFVAILPGEKATPASEHLLPGESVAFGKVRR